MPPRVSLQPVHRAAFRGRFRLGAPLDPSAAGGLATALAALDGVRRAVVRPHTGSVIVETVLPLSHIVAAVETHGIARIEPAVAQPAMGQAFEIGLERARRAIDRETAGALDLRGAVVALLLITAAVQITRGRLAGPATTLLMSALALLDVNRRGVGRAEVP